MSDSRIFNPPVNRITDNDPQIMRVPMDKTDWGFRKGAAPALASPPPVVNLPNGK